MCQAIAFILLLSYSPLWCQENGKYVNTDSLYLGQKHPGITPKIFAPGIVSTDDFEFAITVSNDNKDIFFTRRPTHDSGGNSIMQATYKDGILTMPRLASFAKENYVELAPYCSPDELKVYFHSERAHPKTGKRMINDEKIWYSTKSKEGWSEAEFLTGVLNEGWVMGIAPSRDGTLYLCGEVENKNGILRSVPINDEYNNVEQVLDGVHPYISPDESYIIFDAIGQSWEETYLCICYRKEDGAWSDKIKLPDIINRTNTECFGRMSPNGQFFFFNRDGDIYWVSAKIIYNLIPE
jgi:hypothetical protein